jgi:glycosyltransferase involved in cell wall biosynthesis
MKILFLYAEVTGYLMACLKALRQHPEVSEIRVYQALNLRETGFSFETPQDLPVYDAVGKTAEALLPEIRDFNPDLVFVSGWAFPQYLKLARKLRKTGATMVIGNDTPWYGTLRQRAGALSTPFWLRPLFDVMWVPGTFQYEFARRLGFQKDKIATGLLSADVDAFRAAGQHRTFDSPYTLLSVGSMLPNKGMHRLVEAFETLVAEGLKDWNMLLIGSGPMEQTLPQNGRVKVLPFIQPADLPAVFGQAHAFSLASQKESWGVVIHEAAAAGMPLLVTERAGSTSAFVRDRYNGRLFDPASADDLLEKMRELLTSSQQRLQEMGNRSAELSLQLHPSMWAQTFVNMRLDAK